MAQGISREIAVHRSPPQLAKMSPAFIDAGVNSARRTRTLSAPAGLLGSPRGPTIYRFGHDPSWIGTKSGHYWTARR